MKSIFELAPKELATDAFIAWLFYQLERNNKLEPFVAQIVKTLCGIDDCRKFEIIECKLQYKSTDLILEARINGVPQKILFENKTWSTIHSNQLNRYKSTFPYCNGYRYLKLAFTNSHELELVNKAGYTYVSAEQVYSCLSPCKNISEIIDEYLTYIKSEFIDYPERLKREILNNNSNIFSERQAQLIFLSDLYDELKKNDDIDLWIVTGTNQNGSPWSHLAFYELENAYGETSEYIFYRIDKRSDKTYIRINQYADIGHDYRDAKFERLNLIKNICNEIITSYDLKNGKINTRGDKECEVNIFFFEDNEVSKLKIHLPEIARKICNKLNEIDKKIY